MIRIVQGNPGSGKSYYAANYLGKCATYDPLYKEHLLKPGVLVITNIEQLRLKHLNLSELLQRYPVEQFFTVENFERIQAQYKCNHIVVIIDEAQKIFDSKFYDKDVFYFFQYHRHLGIDIFLLTQSVTTVARQLVPLCEFVIEAQPRSKGMYGVFRYKFKDVKGTFMYSQVIKKKKEIFEMYQSFKSDEAEKPKNVIMHWALIGLVILIAVCVGFKLTISAIQGPKKTATKRQASSRYTGPVGPVQTGAASAVQPNIQTGVASAVQSVAEMPEQPERPQSYWVRVPIMGMWASGDGEKRMILKNGETITRYRNYDAYNSTAEVPYHVAARVPSSGEPLHDKESADEMRASIGNADAPVPVAMPPEKNNVKKIM